MADLPSTHHASTSAAHDFPTYADSSRHPSADSVKSEPSPASSQLASPADTPLTDNPPATAGRKRKANSGSARGVANLTAEQLAKKRANDRQAQRAIRERTKAHIESLEQKVRELSSQKPYLDLQAALRENEAIAAENKEIKKALKSIVDIIQPLLGGGDLMSESNSSNVLNRPVLPPPVASPCDPLDPHTSYEQRAQTTERSCTESTPSVGTPSPTRSLSGAYHQSGSHAEQASSIRHALNYQRHNLTHGLDLGAEERLGFNFLLDGSQQIHKVDGIRRTSDTPRSNQIFSQTPFCAPPLDPPLDDPSLSAITAPIRNTPATCALDAILLDFLHKRQQEAARGVPRQNLVGPPYPSVSSLLNPERSVYSHPVSKVFTDILRTFPDISSLPEQVAILFLMFLLMRWQIYPTQKNYDRLPDWLTPRPSQLLTPHPAWIDYLPWPRMRDRLVMSYQHYPFENWFIPFTRGLSVNWPYEATDCLLSTAESDELMINPVFERHFRNLGNWSLGPGFANAFPALADTARIKTNNAATAHPTS